MSQRTGEDVAFCVRVYGYDVRGVDSYRNPATSCEVRSTEEGVSQQWWDWDLSRWPDWDDDPPDLWNTYMRDAARLDGWTWRR